MRDPISRLLAGSGYVQHNFPGIASGNATREEWWAYAKDPWFTNNYALRVLAANSCCNGSYTDPLHLENAKVLVQRFSIVLDIACLDKGLEALANLLNITLAKPSGGTRLKSHSHSPSRQRIGYDDVYEYLLDKNRLDIQLYEWSKRLALVDCSKI